MKKSSKISTPPKQGTILNFFTVKPSDKPSSSQSSANSVDSQNSNAADQKRKRESPPKSVPKRQKSTIDDETPPPKNKSSIKKSPSIEKKLSTKKKDNDEFEGYDFTENLGSSSRKKTDAPKTTSLAKKPKTIQQDDEETETEEEEVSKNVKSSTSSSKGKNTPSPKSIKTETENITPRVTRSSSNTSPSPKSIKTETEGITPRVTRSSSNTSPSPKSIKAESEGITPRITRSASGSSPSNRFSPNNNNSNNSNNNNNNNNNSSSKKIVEDEDSDVTEPEDYIPHRKLAKPISEAIKKISPKKISPGKKVGIDMRNLKNVGVIKQSEVKNKKTSKDEEESFEDSERTETEGDDGDFEKEPKKKFATKKPSPAKKPPTKKLTVEITPSRAEKVVIDPKEEKKNKEKEKEKTTAAKSSGASFGRNKGDEDDTPKKKGNPNFWKYKQQQRPVPPLKGLKEIPVGKPNCLFNKVFVITGILDSLEREEAEELIRQYAGVAAKSVVKKLTHAIVGEEPGESKMAQIRERKIIQISEDDLFEMIRTLPEKKVVLPPTPTKGGKKPAFTLPTKEKETSKAITHTSSTENSNVSSPSTSVLSSPSTTKKLLGENTEPLGSSSTSSKKDMSVSMLWVDKYRPRSSQDILGNPGAVTSLKQWLISWKKEFEKPDFKKASILYGPPGIGKTTVANIVAKECGYEVIEFNASMTRSQKLIKGENAKTAKTSTPKYGLAEIVGSHSMGEFFRNETGGFSSKTRDVLIIMDEVDGMSGQQDRGGMGELIKMIKKSKVPIICTANDEIKAPKLRSLANYCHEIKFRRPTDNITVLQKTAARLVEISKLEGLTLENFAAEKLLSTTHGDIRQSLHMLQMWKRNQKSKNLDAKEVIRRMEMSEKDFLVTPFKAISKLLTTRADLIDLRERLDLYFVDYSMMPLFVQENYLDLKASGLPNKPLPQSKTYSPEALELYCKAADSICDADLIDRTIYSTQSFDLLPVHGVLSTAAPTFYVQGSFEQGWPKFPLWLGNWSTTRRRYKELRELQTHMRGAGNNTDKTQVCLDYLPYMIDFLAQPMSEKGAEGVQEVIEFMDSYGYNRDDFDVIFDITGGDNLLKGIDSNVKSKFTRSYNTGHHAILVAPKVIKKRGNSAEEQTGILLEEQEEQGVVIDENENVSEDDLGTDKLIKAKAPSKQNDGNGNGKGKKKATTTSQPAKKPTASSSKSKNKGKAKVKNPPKKAELSDDEIEDSSDDDDDFVSKKKKR